ncbi:MAG: hypothetical protein NE334_21625 [Lentisphaeraceae bacterium]|nr:hypothetical protein [Lentisphaeraceae bacterium]
MIKKSALLDLLYVEKETVCDILKPKVVKAQRLSSHQLAVLESFQLLQKKQSRETSFMTFLR